MDILGILTQHQQYVYIFIFLIAILETTILTLTCGFLITTGILNPFLVYLLIVAGDMAMDMLLYALGKFGMPMITRFGLKIGTSLEIGQQTKKWFLTNHLKLIATSKIIHGFGTIGLIMAGIAGIAYIKFFIICFSVSLCKIGILLIIGILLGRAYEQTANYLNLYQFIIVTVFFLIITSFWYIKKPS